MRVVTNTTRLGLLFSKFDATRPGSSRWSRKGKTYVLYPYGAMEAGPIYHAPLPETIELSQALPPGKYRLQSLFAGSADEYSPGVTTTLKVRDDFPDVRDRAGPGDRSRRAHRAAGRPRECGADSCSGLRQCPCAPVAQRRDRRVVAKQAGDRLAATGLVGIAVRVRHAGGRN